MMGNDLPDDLVLTPEQRQVKALLKSLRWSEDMVITNHEGERVWLKPCLNREGGRIGITDCCPEEDPCDHHRTLVGATIVETEQ
jgi:hypothetical protein